MTGQVVSLHALLPVTFRLTGQPDFTIDFVVDTGFTGALTLPLAAVTAMGLPFLEDMRASLATDDEVWLPVHLATIIWDGSEYPVRVIATGKRPLLGTALLRGHELVAQFAENGLVTIDAL